MIDMQQTYGKFGKELSDPTIREMYRADPRAAHKKMQGKFPTLPNLEDGMELKVVSNTTDKTHIVFPVIGNSYTLKGEQLGTVNAAGQGLSTLATLCSSISTASCVPF